MWAVFASHLKSVHFPFPGGGGGDEWARINTLCSALTEESWSVGLAIFATTHSARDVEITVRFLVSLW